MFIFMVMAIIDAEAAGSIKFSKAGSESHC